MTIELLNERKQILGQQLQNAQLRLQDIQNQSEQAKADINAILGALQDVEFWIGKLSEN